MGVYLDYRRRKSFEYVSKYWKERLRMKEKCNMKATVLV